MHPGPCGNSRNEAAYRAARGDTTNEGQPLALGSECIQYKIDATWGKLRDTGEASIVTQVNPGDHREGQHTPLPRSIATLDCLTAIAMNHVLGRGACARH